MIPHVVTIGDITDEDLSAFAWVRGYVSALESGFDCHTVCGLIERHLDIPVVRVRGWFARRGWDHSWLVIRGRPVIIDPYPWCCASGPIMVYTGGTLNPWRDLYIPHSKSPMPEMMRDFKDGEAR